LPYLSATQVYRRSQVPRPQLLLAFWVSTVIHEPPFPAAAFPCKVHCRGADDKDAARMRMTSGPREPRAESQMSHTRLEAVPGKWK